MTKKNLKIRQKKFEEAIKNKDAAKVLHYLNIDKKALKELLVNQTSVPY